MPHPMNRDTNPSEPKQGRQKTVPLSQHASIPLTVSVMMIFEISALSDQRWLTNGVLVLKKVLCVDASSLFPI